MRLPRVFPVALLVAPMLLLSLAHGQLTAKKTQRAARVEADPPLTDREKAAQLLNRFTFGPRPGDLDLVLKMGPQKWFEQQLNPAAIADPVVEKRIQDYPALALTPALTVSNFPTNQILRQISQGKLTEPSDSTAAVYKVLEAKYARQEQAKKDEQSNKMSPEQMEAQKASQKKLDQAEALTLAGQMLAVPKEQRMAAILKLPIDQRIVLTSNTPETQRRMLLADFTPREREMLLAMGGGSDAAHVVDEELQQAKVVRAILSERQLQEVMTDFWFNHFNVFMNKETDQIYTPSYERDAIRPFALGKFRDLLLATAEHPAMLVYLDNRESIGPKSEVAERPQGLGKKLDKRGLNENYGREVMELHTVGVNGGYTQADVTSLSEILTGWTVDHPELGSAPVFDARKHEPGSKIWFGQKVKEDGFKEGQTALLWLAAQPQTAHFISYKLAQRFVADDPPPALVDRMAKSFLASGGDIKTVLRTMERSPEFWSRRYYRTKMKTPLEFVASAFRATGTDPTNPQAIVYTLKTMGEPLYQMQPPTGYPMTADHWMNSAAIVARLNFSLALTNGTLGGKVNGIPFDAPRLLSTEMLESQSERAASPIKRVSETSGAATPADGREEALASMDQMVAGGAVSEKTNGVILQQVSEADAGAAPTNSTKTLNTMAALILGSPEFQLK